MNNNNNDEIFTIVISIFAVVLGLVSGYVIGYVNGKDKGISISNKSDCLGDKGKHYTLHNND